MPAHLAAHYNRWQIKNFLATALAVALLLAATCAFAGKQITVTGIVGVSDTATFVMDDTGATYILPNADVMEGDRVRVVGTLVDRNGEAAIEATSVELLDEAPATTTDDAPAGATVQKN